MHFPQGREGPKSTPTTGGRLPSGTRKAGTTYTTARVAEFSAEDPSGGLRQGVAPPRLDVYVGGEPGIDFSKVKVPAGVAVTDERADAAGFPGGSAVVGDVYDMTTSKPVAGAKVALASEKAYKVWDDTAATGR